MAKPMRTCLDRHYYQGPSELTRSLAAWPTHTHLLYLISMADTHCYANKLVNYPFPTTFSRLMLSYLLFFLLSLCFHDVPEHYQRPDGCSSLSISCGFGCTLNGVGVCTNDDNDAAGGQPLLTSGNNASASKKNSSRRNAWGNLSYADLITQAISSAPETRLTLSQIYEWMVQNVPYFKDKGDSNSSAGWKVSARGDYFICFDGRN